MRTKKQYKLKVWLATFGVALFSGVLAVGSFFIEKYSKASAISYDDTSYEITLTETDWSLSYNNLYQYLMDNSSSLVGKVKASYLQEQEIDLSYSSGLTIFPYFNGQDLLGFGLDNKFVTTDDFQDLEDGRIENNIDYDIIFVVDSAFYSAFKSAIALDITANTPTFSGQIIDAIKSGLGLIGQLAQEFLLGFTTLFWTGTELTEFGIFSLCFLGLAISFAIVRLIMNIVRSNTGV